ncbi:MAG: hypothetical protein H0U95_04945 [Bacteroidetes bacterium]|nr:hypothetical protein [Bacteroidota bacterium]
MNKYIATLIFYIASFIIIYVLNLLSPGAQDGGWGLGSVAVILLVFVIVALIGISSYKGIKKSKSYFILTAIHFLILLGLLSTFFM